ncbi:hypothetical protein VIGAN_09177800, partial [Vigna angularis var. angularis]
MTQQPVSLSPSQPYHAWENTKQTPQASTLCYFPKGQKVPISQKQFFIRHHSHIHKVELQSIPLITITITLNIKIKLNFSQLFMLHN